MRRSLAFFRWAGVWGASLAWVVGVSGQGVDEVVSGEKFDQRSLALRTALFHDPSLEQPLESLLQLYQKAGREEELLGLYRGHLAQYPDDAGSQAVLVRLLLSLKRPEASAAAAAAAAAHPDDPLSLYLRFTDLQRQRDGRALDALSRAVEVEPDLLRKSAWTEELVRAALAEDRRDLAEKHLRALAAVPGQSAAQLGGLAQRLNRDGFPELALEVAAAASRGGPSPELTVELELQSAAAEAALGKRPEAAARLELLLTKVAPDYARRSEIVARRVALLGDAAERAAHLKKARAVWEAAPESEAAALDLAELLAASELRREALGVLRTAAERLPRSSALERAVLDAFDRLGDERGIRDFLHARVEAHPDRSDLTARLVSALYALGESEEAARRFEALVAPLPEADQGRRRLDLARALRRMTLPAEAAVHLEKVLSADPRRLEVRRELAEARLAANDPEGARRLMREALAPDAEIENFLDVVGFMMGPESTATWPEARDALRSRLEREPKNFEVAVLLIDMHGRLGEQAEGEVVLERARLLADTEARYRRWLEAAMALAEAVDGSEAFFDAEQGRLVAAAADGDGWTPERISRYLLFCEVANQNDVEPRLIAALKERLESSGTPEALRVPVRRMLVEALRRDPTQAVEVQNHLQALATEDASRADEYRLRLARAGHEAAERDGGRPDQVRGLLRAIDFGRIGDAALLRGAHSLFLAYAYPEPAMAVLERLTVLEPGDPAHWEKWISALALQGDEDRLREALRRVLAGVTADPLSPDSLERLRGHLVDSCWRSVARVFAAEDPARMPEIFPLLELIERTRSGGPEQLWVTWARGRALLRMGQAEAAAEAATTLEAQAGHWFATRDEPPRLRFPDGLVMALDQALASLRESPDRPAAPAESPAGPERPPGLRWGFIADNGATISQIAAVGNPGSATRAGASAGGASAAGASAGGAKGETARPEGGDDGRDATGVIAMDMAGTLYHVEATTGKLRWRRSGLWAGASSAPTPVARGRRARSAAGFFGNDGNQPVTTAPRLAVDEAGGRVLVSRDGRLQAVAVADGGLLWRAELAGASRRVPPQPGVAPLPPLADEVMLDADGRVLLWRAETATAAAFHPETGKLLWVRDLSLEAPPPQIGPLNAGAACDGVRLLVYGQRPCVLDTSTGAILWSFGGESVREFPVALKTEPDGTTAGVGGSAPTVAAPPWSAGRGGFLPGGAAVGPRRLTFNYLRPLNERAGLLGQWMSGQGALVAPAVAWSEQSWQPIGGEFARGRLVLATSGLVISPSLDLPLGGPRFDGITGTWLGTTSGRAVFLNERTIVILDLARGGWLTVPIDAVVTPAAGASAGASESAALSMLAADGTVAGPRVFVTGPAGLLAVNPINGRILFSEVWSEEVRDFAGFNEPSRPASPALPAGQMVGGGRSVQYTPRHFVHSTGASTVALRPRVVARGRWVFAVLGADRIAGFADD